MSAQLTVIDGGQSLEDAMRDDECVSPVETLASPVSEIPGQPPIATMDDATALAVRGMLVDEKRNVLDQIGHYIHLIDSELERRIKARGPTARSIPDQRFSVNYAEQFTPYAFDLKALHEVAGLLPDDEHTKICKHVPEFIPAPVPAHYEPGLPVSFTALVKKYGEDSEVGKKLQRVMRRDSCGFTLEVKERKQPMQRVPVTTNGGAS